MKSSNPKDGIAAGKIPLHLWPECATVYGALALLDGATKYGRSNWRSSGVLASVYVDACRRHLGRWFEGENDDKDSGLPNLAHALACIAILVDATEQNTLNDDRQYNGDGLEILDYMAHHVARIKEKNAEKDPKHFTIENK